MGGLIKLTLLSGRGRGHKRKLMTNFETAKLKTLKVMGLETSSEKKTIFGGKGGSDQTNTPLRGSEESSKEAHDQITER